MSELRSVEDTELQRVLQAEQSSTQDPQLRERLAEANEATQIDPRVRCPCCGLQVALEPGEPPRISQHVPSTSQKRPCPGSGAIRARAKATA